MGPWPRVGHASAVRHLAYSPDGQLLATGDDAGMVLLWRAPFDDLPVPIRLPEIRTLRQRLRRHWRKPHPVYLGWDLRLDDGVEGLAFVRGGRGLAVAVRGAIEIHALDGQPSAPDVVVVGLHPPLVADGEHFWATEDHSTRPPNRSDGDLPQDLILVSATTGARLRQLHLAGRGDSPNDDLHIDTVRRRVLECRDTMIYLWDLETGEVVERVDLDPIALGVSPGLPQGDADPDAPRDVYTGPALLSPSGRHLAAVLRSGGPPLLVVVPRPEAGSGEATTVRRVERREDFRNQHFRAFVWETTSSGERLIVQDLGPPSVVWPEEEAHDAKAPDRPDGRTDASASSYESCAGLLPSPRHAAGGWRGEVWAGDQPLTHVSAHVLSLAFGPGGVLVTAHEDDRIRTWNLSSGELRSVRGAPPGSQWGLDVPGGRMWWVEESGRSARCTLVVADLDTGDTIAAFSVPRHTKRISLAGGRLAAMVPPVGRSFADSRFGQITVWNLDDPHPMLEIRTERVRGRNHALSPDGRRLARAEAGLGVVDLESGHETLLDSDVAGHGNEALAWSPDGRRLVAVIGFVIESWVLDGPPRVVRLSGPMDGQEVAVTNAGRIGVTSYYDPHICLLEPDSDRGVARCGHHGRGRAAAFSDDGRWLVTGSTGGVICLWDPAHPRRPRLTLHLLPDGGWVSVTRSGAWIGERIGRYRPPDCGPTDPRGVARALRLR